MTKNELVYSIKEFLSSQSDDAEIIPEHIWNSIKTARATLIEKEYDSKDNVVAENILQSLCLEMEQTSSSLCGGIGGCVVLKSKEKLPTILNIYNGYPAIIRVKPLDILAENIEIVSLEDVSPILDTDYDVTLALVVNQHLILIGNTIELLNMKKVNVWAILRNPEDLADFTCSDGSVCWNDDTSEVPVTGMMASAIEMAVMKMFGLSLEYEKYRDRNNNSEST